VSLIDNTAKREITAAYSYEAMLLIEAHCAVVICCYTEPQAFMTTHGCLTECVRDKVAANSTALVLRENVDPTQF
jgi:hypothetical protein